jgi:hypothetical protein
MNNPDLPTKQASPQFLAASELAGAQNDLTRLSALLNDAFHELLTSFNSVQTVVQRGGNLAEIEQFAGRAIHALQCEDLSSQLIDFTQRRLSIVQESLKIAADVPQIAMTNAVWAAGIAACADLAAAGPVQQDAMGAGTIDLF